MKHLKPYVLPLSLAVLQWLVTTLLRVDRVFFTYDHVTPWFVATKVLYFLFLAVAWCFCFAAVRNVRAGKPQWKRGAFVFGCYFTIMLVFLLLMWPGTWSWDDIAHLDTISTYESWNPWHHFITGAYQSVFLQVLPFPAGIIFLQEAVISLCVAFVVTKLEQSFELHTFQNKWLDVFVKVLPFLAPPILIYQFSGYRLALYIYVELVMLVMLLCAWKDKKEWSVPYLLLFAFLAVLAAAWRTESFLYLPLVCILIPCMEKDVLPKAKKAVCLALILVGFLGVFKFQSVALGNNNYTLMSFMRPAAELIRAADPEADKEDLAVMDKVVSVDVVLANPDIDGEHIQLRTNAVRDYSEEEFSGFLKSFVHMSLKHPKVVLEERTKLFLHASGAFGDAVTCTPTAVGAFEPGSTIETAEILNQHEWFANKPISVDVRRATINALSCRKTNGTYMQKPYRVVWNTLIPELVLLAAWIATLSKKKWWPFAILTAVLLRLPIIYLTEPSGWFMYQLSFYLLGYTVLVFSALWGAGRRIAKEQENETPDKETLSHE